MPSARERIRLPHLWRAPVPVWKAGPKVCDVEAQDLGGTGDAFVLADTAFGDGSRVFNCELASCCRHSCTRCGGGGHPGGAALPSRRADGPLRAPMCRLRPAGRARARSGSSDGRLSPGQLRSSALSVVCPLRFDLSHQSVVSTSPGQPEPTPSTGLSPRAPPSGGCWASGCLSRASPGTRGRSPSACD